MADGAEAESEGPAVASGLLLSLRESPPCPRWIVTWKSQVSAAGTLRFWITLFLKQIRDGGPIASFLLISKPISCRG